jgi:hypothetical protein
LESNQAINIVKSGNQSEQLYQPGEQTVPVFDLYLTRMQSCLVAYEGSSTVWQRWKVGNIAKVVEADVKTEIPNFRKGLIVTLK